MIAADAFVAPGAKVSGEVTIGSRASVWFGAVVRGEAAAVVIDDEANVQDNAVVEGLPGHPARIGARVTLGHNARVFGATVEPCSMIAIGATVLAGAVIGTRSIIAANATVPEGMIVPPGKLVIGEGRVLRDVSEAEIQRTERGATEYARLAGEYAATLR